MDPAQISSLVLGALVTIGAIGQWLSVSARKRRKRDSTTIARQDKTISAMTAWGDLAQDYIYRSRSLRREHDADHHPDGTAAIGVIDIPPDIEAGIRSVIVREDDDDAA
ncbi:hypothetical protein CGZ93_17960 [Enemella dayhoffiae]|uniref:Uncharacterized protein n=1 Tax=Enemella dayhoffiae TaxID=2016507 RepID=A0A255GPZ9_9ACTN|nr:hypothetical protein [Enemella dayhoffiae]OYO16646.1 hypothetical protein CGZ93_17960 [Enemella dayhoffiae]